MPNDISLTVDISNFKSTFKEYMKYSKRDLTESVNTHAYFIARNAVSTTPAASKDIIAQQLNSSSARYSTAPLAAILVNAKRGKEGKKGFNGIRMANAVEKFIRKSQSTVNYFRAGWLTSMRAIQPYTAKRGGTTIPTGVRVKSKNLGGAKPAMETATSWNPIANIWNSVKIHNAEGLNKLQVGAQKALNMEVASMREYINKKQIQLCNKLWS